MSQVFHGTIFSLPSKLKFDPEVEKRKKLLREERDQLQSQLDSEGFKFQGNDCIPKLANSDPIYRAVEKALERFPS